jgi:ribosome biogenesis protein Nip4
MRKACTILVGKAEWKRPLRRPRSIQEDNIRRYLREIGCRVVNWIHLAQGMVQGRFLVNMVMNFGTL